MVPFHVVAAPVAALVVRLSLVLPFGLDQFVVTPLALFHQSMLPPCWRWRCMAASRVAEPHSATKARACTWTLDMMLASCYPQCWSLQPLLVYHTRFNKSTLHKLCNTSRLYLTAESMTRVVCVFIAIALGCHHFQAVAVYVNR